MLNERFAASPAATCETRRESSVVEFWHGHPRALLTVRVLLGIWLAVVTVGLRAHSYWWGLTIVAPMVLNAYLAARVVRNADRWRAARSRR